MSFAKSFYADQKPVERQQENVVPVAIPTSTPIAEDPLTPAQIQEAIRLYRSALSASAPSSPVRHSEPQVRQAVHSNYYGGGPTDIPLSYLNNNYSTPTVPEPHQQLVEKLENLKVQEVATPVAVAQVQNNHYADPSEYIGMANDNKFIYDAQKAAPKSYSQPQVVIRQVEKEPEEHGTTTTEDVTQVPASPAITSRFRAAVQNVRSPIVVERVEEPVYTSPPVNNYAFNNYGSFNQMESEYQLPVLNDLASCIEHY